MSGAPLRISSADIHFDNASGVEYTESGKIVQTAKTFTPKALDSRMADDDLLQLERLNIVSPTGARLSAVVMAVVRLPDEEALYESYVEIHLHIGKITLDGNIMTFEDGMQGIFQKAGFTIVPGVPGRRSRRLQGAFELIGLFNSISR